MPLMLIIRDKNGKVINFGPWDDLGGRNPLPAGATGTQENVTTDRNGNRYLTSEAPPIEKAVLTAEELATHLISKSVVTRSDIDAIKTSR